MGHKAWRYDAAIYLGDAFIEATLHLGHGLGSGLLAGVQTVRVPALDKTGCEGRETGTAQQGWLCEVSMGETHQSVLCKVIPTGSEGEAGRMMYISTKYETQRYDASACPLLTCRAGRQWPLLGMPPAAECAVWTLAPWTAQLLLEPPRPQPAPPCAAPPAPGSGHITHHVWCEWTGPGEVTLTILAMGNMRSLAWIVC